MGVKILITACCLALCHIVMTSPLEVKLGGGCMGQDGVRAGCAGDGEQHPALATPEQPRLAARGGRKHTEGDSVACFLWGHKSEKLEKAGTVDSKKNTPRARWGPGPGGVDTRFPAGLPFPVPEILEFMAFRDACRFFQRFSRTFPEFSSGTPEQTPETATAFSSFLSILMRSDRCRRRRRCAFTCVSYQNLSMQTHWV